ncbi:MAG TPA: alpha/beta fold hydrolase [Blastocatellia bacterium]|nr:alpha/beta fold hydrolase [Blastocatellia bacterium]
MSLKALRRLTGLIVFLLTLTALAVAQDAAQVLRLSVGFNSLKNTLKAENKLSGDQLAEVERLGELAKQANAAGRYGEALKHMYHGIALMRGQAWTPQRALSAALTFKVDHAMLEPNEPFTVRIGQIYALDEPLAGKLNGTVALLPLKGDERLKEWNTIDNVEADFTRQPLEAKILAPDVPPGNYRLALKLQAPAGEPMVKTITVHVERGLSAQVTSLKQRAAKLEADFTAKQRTALLAALPSVRYRLSLYDLASAGEIGFERLDFQGELKEAAAMLDALAAGRDPFAGRKGDFRKAYLSKADNSLQPYRVFVPSSYDGTRSFPLVIALHGMGGDENSYFEHYANGLFKEEAERHGYLVACPKGRGPASMYMGDAERDVLDVMAEMMRAYRVDPDRVYLTGHSMGGFGTLSIAMDHPELFAAIAPVAGGVMSPLGLAKIARVPQLLVHGDADRTVPVERSRLIVAAGKKLGAEVKYIEVPGGDHGSVVAPHFKDVFDWFDAHKRKPNEAAAAAGAKSN